MRPRPPCLPDCLYAYLPKGPRLPYRPTVRFRSTLPGDNAPYFEYRPIEGVERPERYRPGGYHPMMVGDVFNDRYRVVHKLGHGTYSTAWLSRNEQRAAYVAVQVGTADSPGRESDILHRLCSQSDAPSRSMIPTVQDQFEVRGPNGVHRCTVVPPAQSSVAATSSSRLFGIETARALIAELILAAAYIHSRGFVHGGILLACAIWSVRGPRPLFDATLATHDDIVSQQVDLLGPLPREWWDGWDARLDYFDEIQALRRKSGLGGFVETEKAVLLEMLGYGLDGGLGIALFL